MPDLRSHSDFQKDSLELRFVDATWRAPYWDTNAHKQDLQGFFLQGDCVSGWMISDLGKAEQAIQTAALRAN